MLLSSPTIFGLKPSTIFDRMSLSFGLYFVGLYIMLNGIVGVKDMVTTWAIALILLGVAAYISIKSGVEMLNG